MQALFPEGFAFTRAMTGLAWVQVGLGVAEDDPLRRRALTHSRAALAAVRSAAGTAPFPEYADPPFGAFYAGWMTQLQIGTLLLVPQGERDPAELAALQASCDALADAYDSSGGPWLSSYRGMAWQADNVVAVSALARCDRLLGGYRASVDRWVAKAQADVDPDPRGAGVPGRPPDLGRCRLRPPAPRHQHRRPCRNRPG